MNPRPFLRVLPSPGDTVPEVRFCGYCGHRPGPAAQERVCGACHLGVVLVAPGTVAPQPGQPSLVVDQALTVCAVSQAAEELLGVAEPDIVGRALADVLAPAQAEGIGLETLVGAVMAAAVPDGSTERAVVRPAGEWGIRYAARLGPCGPPRAVLLVLDDDEV
jgi:hypothetical protein